MDQYRIDALVASMIKQGMGWQQINFAISLIRNEVTAERKRCEEVCTDYMKSNPDYKSYENTYLDGWQDACNDIQSAIRTPE